MAHRRSSRHIVLWRRKTPIPSSHRLNRQLPATSLAACFLAAFLTGVLLLPQCPGFDRVVALSAGLSGPLRQQQTQNSDTQDATSVSEQTVPPSDDDIQPVESSSSALTEDPASEQTESLPAADPNWKSCWKARPFRMTQRSCRKTKRFWYTKPIPPPRQMSMSRWATALSKT